MNQCKNNYSNTIEFNQSFGNNDKEIKICTTCKYFSYDNGISICKLFNSESEDNSFNEDR